MLGLGKFSEAGDTLALKNYSAVGSMPAASNQLTLTSNPGFAVNDPIIVEIGGETGAGLRGSKGVGGTWPALSFANVGAMDADTGQVANTYAWVEASGNVYQYVASVWTAVTSYYIAKAIPRALITTITAVNGLVLTLAASSVVATTAAAVHFDNAAIINTLTQFGAATPTNSTLIIPNGDYAISARILIDRQTRWALRGNDKTLSKLYSPKGCPSAQVMVSQCTGVLVRDFYLQGNVQANGFGLAWPQFVTETLVSQGDGYPRGVWFRACNGCTARNLKITDVFFKAVGASSCLDCWAYNCESVLTETKQVYIQWEFQFADCIGGGIVDCTVDSPHLVAGFEIFRCKGTKIIRPVGRNATISSNSSGQFLIDAPDITIEANSQLSATSFSSSNPVININSNISPPNPAIAQGGEIRNPRIIQQGAINVGGDVLQPIIVNIDNPNVTVTGTYPDTPSPKGYIEFPNTTKGGAMGVGSTGARTVVDGIRIVGVNADGDFGNIKTPADGIIRNCVAETILVGVQTNNQNNATWEAGHP